jgi:DNA processing protein
MNSFGRVSIYEMALHLAEGVGGVTARNLLIHFGSAENIFKAKKHQLLQLQGIGAKVSQALTENQSLLFQKAEKEINDAEKYGIQILFFSNEAYPKRLKHIDDAPILLYQKGNTDLNQDKTIAVVGTRQSTSYGKNFIEKLLLELKAYKPLIISGMAYGIDIIAHRESLHHELLTVGVLANGLDTLYPSAHQNTAEQMIAHGGALISEFPLGTRPDAPRFPARNRITAALSDVVIVVESMKKGGAMITAQYANDYNREVFALPGNIGLTTSEGCNHLIKTHQAHLITSAEDIAYIMNWGKISDTSPKKNLNLNNLNLSDAEISVIKFLFEKEEASLDEMCLLLGIPLNQMAVILLNLEMQDFINALPGKRFNLKTKLFIR